MALKQAGRILSVFFIGLLAGVIGLLAGTLSAGITPNIVMFNGVQGYETTGQVGAIIGAAVSLIAGWLLLFKCKRRNTHG